MSDIKKNIIYGKLPRQSKHWDPLCASCKMVWTWTSVVLPWQQLPASARHAPWSPIHHWSTILLRQQVLKTGALTIVIRDPTSEFPRRFWSIGPSRHRRVLTRNTGFPRCGIGFQEFPDVKIYRSRHAHLLWHTF